MNRWLAAGLVALTATASLTACSAYGHSGDTIVLGATVSLTGAYASTGTNVSRGYETAVAQINSHGGVLGRKVSLDLEDDQSNVANVGRTYADLLANDRVDALLSPYGSALAGPAAQLAERYKIPMAHSLTSSPALFDGLHYSVMAGLPPGGRVLSDIPAFAAQRKYTRFTLVNNDLDAFKSICDGVAAKVSDVGGTARRVSYAATTSNFSSTALRVQQSKPQVVVECSAIQDSIGLTRALSQQGVQPDMLVSATADDPAFGKSLGKLSERAMGYSTWAPALKKPGALAFEQAYKKRYGEEPENPAAGAYATVQVLVDAMRAAGSTDHDKVNNALHRRTFPTVLGTFRVDKFGVQTGYRPVLEQYQGGVYKIVYPRSTASVPAQLPYSTG